jgi:hypothetical protein
VLNNIFVGIDNAGATDRPLAYLPAITDDAETDGNCYWGIDREPGIRLLVREPAGIRFGRIGGTAASGDPDLLTSDYFLDSTTAHPPGYEAHGTTADPRLRRYTEPLPFPLVEDLRLVEGSSAHHGGVELTDPVLREIDGNPPRGNAQTAAAIPSTHPRSPWESTACAPSPATHRGVKVPPTQLATSAPRCRRAIGVVSGRIVSTMRVEMLSETLDMSGGGRVRAGVRRTPAGTQARHPGASTSREARWSSLSCSTGWR